MREFELFAIDLGYLPLRGGTTLYKERIRKSIQILKAKHKILDKLILPVQLDVQVVSSKHQVSKDLDNIMRDIAPIFSEELLRSESYLQGYRIYVADSVKSDYFSDFLHLKLLPMNGIFDFENRIEKTFEVAQEWLEEELKSYF